MSLQALPQDQRPKEVLAALRTVQPKRRDWKDAKKTNAMLR